jgi:hypothetical protein
MDEGDHHEDGNICMNFTNILGLEIFSTRSTSQKKYSAQRNRMSLRTLVMLTAIKDI